VEQVLFQTLKQREAEMTFSRDFDNYAAVAKDRQAEILRISAASDGPRPGARLVVGVGLAVVCAPLAALFLLRVW
jgi:hypothetical protein